MNRLRRCFADRRGLVNTTDLVVASGATIILAAGVAAASLAGIDQAKLGKAQPDAQAISSAMQAFFKDTGKWPGQAEVAASDGSNVKQARMLTTNRNGTLPAFGTLTTIKTDTATCGANSLEGFASGSVQIFGFPQPGDGETANYGAPAWLNVNDFLVRKPDASKYPNWRGPYLQTEITDDPFGRVWIINTMPLFCAEDVAADTSSTGTSTAGNLGFAWIITAGSNRTLTTALKNTRLDANGDDAGVNLGKLTKSSRISGF